MPEDDNEYGIRKGVKPSEDPKPQEDDNLQEIKNLKRSRWRGPAAVAGTAALAGTLGFLGGRATAPEAPPAGNAPANVRNAEELKKPWREIKPDAGRQKELEDILVIDARILDDLITVADKMAKEQVPINLVVAEDQKIAALFEKISEKAEKCTNVTIANAIARLRTAQAAGDHKLESFPKVIEFYELILNARAAVRDR